MHAGVGGKFGVFSWEPTTVDWLAIAAVSVADCLAWRSEVPLRVAVNGHAKQRTLVLAHHAELSLHIHLDWPVIILSAAFFIIMLVSVACILSGVHGVNRDLVVLCFSNRDRVFLAFMETLYCHSSLVRSISDAVAALLARNTVCGTITLVSSARGRVICLLMTVFCLSISPLVVDRCWKIRGVLIGFGVVIGHYL